MHTYGGLLSLIGQRGGLVRTRDILAHGITNYSIAKAVDAGVVLRPMQGWVSVPHADPGLLLAAKHNVVLTCVTQAKRLGLWIPQDPEQCHVAVRGNGSNVQNRALVVHWMRPLLQRHPDVLEDRVPNVLACVADCQPFEVALVIWESAARLGLVTLHQLHRLALRPAARRVLEACLPFSDSGLETIMRAKLQWLRVPLRQQIHLEGHRVDLLIGSRLVVQIDGAHHVGSQRSEDIAHDRMLVTMGYTVARF